MIMAVKSSLTITKRKVKNVNTGIDMNVPSYVPADSPRNVKYFHVVVISTLPHFKSEEHSEEDTVQFMVQRDYEAFEKLQKELIQQYPELKLPMPRKYYLFMSEEDLEDRRVSFDCLLTVVAGNKELCTSIPMLIFLGIDLLADRKYAKRRKEYLKKQTEQDKGSQEEEEELDLFSQNKSQEQTNNAEMDEDLFGDSSEQTKKVINESVSVKVSLLADELEYQDALYLAEQNNGEQKNDQTYEEDSELKRLTDSLNDDLVIPASKQKDKKPAPVLNQEAKKKVKDLLFEDDEDTNKGASIMTTNDVMDYLKKNINDDDDDDLSLF